MKFGPNVSADDRMLLSGRLMDDSYVDRVEADPLNGELVVTVIVTSPERVQARWDEYFETLPENEKRVERAKRELLERIAVIDEIRDFATNRPKTDTAT